MRYLGGKFKASPHIAKIINQHALAGNVYLEPFMGSCWVTRLVQFQHRIAADLHDELVQMFIKLQQGWVPPNITEDEYNEIRAHKSQKYPKELVAFAGFGCAFAGSYFRKYAGEIHPARSRRSLLKKMEHLQDVHFLSTDYRKLKPRGCVIYCDPPYSDSFGFRITGIRGNGSFDTCEFWEIMREWSDINLVFISEIKAPDDFDCVMELPIKSGVRTTRGHEIRVEKLFCKKKNVQLLNLDNEQQLKNFLPSLVDI